MAGPGALTHEIPTHGHYFLYEDLPYRLNTFPIYVASTGVPSSGHG